MRKLKKFRQRISMLVATIMLLGLVQVPLPASAEETATVEETTTAEASTGEYEIIPSPHSISYGDEYTVYNEAINVVYSEGSLDSVTIDYIKEIFGSENVTFSANADDTKTNLYLTRDDMDDEVEAWIRATYAEEIDDSVLAEDESHIIIADANGISIIGNDDVGLFRGLTTIKFIQSQIKANEKGYRHFVIKDYADMAFRGLIEGYYGETWAWSEKAELLRFGSDYKMNKVVYAPKFDPYHFSKWYELYPDETEDSENNIQNVEIAASMGQKYKADFVWTAHPFNAGIQYKEGDEDIPGSGINLLKAKFQQVYDAGVRSFGLLLDDGTWDITDESLAEVTAIVNIMAEWCADKGDCDDLIFCPFLYGLKAMKDLNQQAYEYQELSYYDRNFKDNVQIITTGHDTFSDTDQAVADAFKRDGITEQAGYQDGEERRSPLMWTNYPTTDYNPYLNIGPINNFKTDLNPDDMVGMVSNPLQWAHLNKLVIPMVTQYTWNLKDYDADEVYNTSLKYIMGSEELANAMMIFSVHNKFNLDEGQGIDELKSAIAAFKVNMSKENAERLFVELNKVIDACNTLLVEDSYTDLGVYKQLSPYAKSLRDLCEGVQKYMSLFDLVEDPFSTVDEAGSLIGRSGTTYVIGSEDKCAVTGYKTLIPFTRWLGANKLNILEAAGYGEDYGLEILIQRVDNMNLAGYSEESVAALKTSFEAAKAVANDVNATQEQRDAATADLKASKEALVQDLFIVADTNMSVYGGKTLKNLKNLFDGSLNTTYFLYSGQSVGDYVQFTFKEIIPLSKFQIIVTTQYSYSISNADFEVSEDGVNWTTVGQLTSGVADQTISFDEVNVKHARISITENTEDRLDIREVIFNGAYFVSKSDLNNLINELDDIDIYKYTAESLAALNTALESAKAVLENDDATQIQLNEAYGNLKAAKEGLEDASFIVVTTNRQEGGYKNLEDIVDGSLATDGWFINGQKAGDYIQFAFKQEISLSKFQIIYCGENYTPINADFQVSEDGENWTTLGQLTNGVAEQTIGFDEVNVKYARILITEDTGAWLDIWEVIFNDTYFASKVAINNLIKEIEAIDMTKYTKASVAALNASLEAAKEVLANDDAAQDQIQEAYENLKAAKEGLEVAVHITKQPESVSVCKGRNATVTVEAEGKDLTYTWYYKNPGSRKFNKSGSDFVDGNTYSIPMYAWRDGQQVFCVVTDAYGDKVTSEIVTLSMREAAITITKQPKDVVVDLEGDTATVTVEAEGEGLTYTWYYKNPGNNKFYVSGDDFVDGNSYSIPVTSWRDGQQVYCVITDANGDTVKTETVTLSVLK